MNTKTFFISDVHLGLSSPEKEKKKLLHLLSFLTHARTNGQALFILGDLFDAWIEYRTVVPKGYHKLLTALEDLGTAGVAIHYLVGNHDFWMRNYFRTELGIKTYPEPFSVAIDGKKFFLHHGDGLATNDVGYRILKRVLRHPVAVWLFSWIHPDIGLKLARSSSRHSRTYTSGKDFGESDGMRSFAANQIAQGYDIVVMGHRHQATIIELGGGLYVNLGDWLEDFTYGEFTNGRLELKRWSQL